MRRFYEILDEANFFTTYKRLFEEKFNLLFPGVTDDVITTMNDYINFTYGNFLLVERIEKMFQKKLSAQEILDTIIRYCDIQFFDKWLIDKKAIDQVNAIDYNTIYSEKRTINETTNNMRDNTSSNTLGSSVYAYDETGKKNTTSEEANNTINDNFTGTRDYTETLTNTGNKTPLDISNEIINFNIRNNLLKVICSDVSEVFCLRIYD